MAERRDHPLEPGESAFVEGERTARPASPESRPTDSAPDPDDRKAAELHQDIRHTRAEMSETLGEIQQHFDRDRLTDLSASPGPATSPESARIQRDIQHTRAEMSETLDALGHRLSPNYIKEQVKDSVRSTAHDAGTSMLDTIKTNPIPSLIAGLSVGWLIMKAGKSDDDRAYYDRHYRAGYYGPEYGRGYASGREPYPYGGGYAEGQSWAGQAAYEAREGAEGAAHGAREWAGDVAEEARERVGEAAHEAREWAGDVAHEAGHLAQEAAHDIQRYGRRATNWLEHTMEENPLAAGALAIAAGALVGLAVPETRQEHRLLGPTSDRIKEQAQHLAEEKIEQVKAVADETVEQVKEGVQEVTSTTREEAREVARTAEQESRRQGLTGGS